MLKNDWYRVRIFCILVLVTLLGLTSANATKTSAGTTITNQAEISWFDTETGVVNHAYSNVATVIVAQQFSLLLESDIVRHTQPSRSVAIPHRLINTGNIKSAYELRVRHKEGDADDLSNLKLFSDVNGNGLADPGEGELLAVPCEPLEANVSCYHTSVLKPAKILEFVISGITPSNGVAGDRYEMNIRAFPLHYDQVLQGNTVVDPSLPREMSTAFTEAIEESSLPESWVNNDLVDIIEGAILSLNKMATPACGVPIKSGQPITYQISFTNVGDAMPVSRVHLLDGSAITGIVLQDTIPPNVTLSKTPTPLTAPSQSIAVVQLKMYEDTNRWVSFENWNGSDVISKIGQYIPASAIGPNQSGKLYFEVTVNQNVTATTIYNQAEFDLVEGGVAEFESNNVCTNIEPANTRSGEGQQPDITYDATIRFLTPVLDIKRDITQNGTTPDFYKDEDFERANIYRLDSGLSSYNNVRDGVYVELTSSAVNKDEDTAETIVVTVTSGTGDTLQVTLLETGPNTGIFRSIHPIRLSDTEAGQGRSCPASATVPNFSGSEPNCVLSGDADGNLSVTATVTFDNGQTAEVLEDAALIDPLGIVFDSAYNTPVEGATVWIKNADGSIALDPLTDIPYEPQVTDSEGFYQFPFLYANQNYYLDVQPPAQYTFPSIVAAGALNNLGREVNEYSYGKDGYLQEVLGSGIFNLTSLLVVDIPLDPELDNDLSVQKTSSLVEGSIGGFVDYSVRIKNSSGRALYAVKINDTLPRGFNYVNGTAEINGKKVDDPEGAPRPNLVFSGLPFVEGSSPGQLNSDEHVLTYRVRLTAGAVDSDGINRVIADGRTETGLPISSNESSVQVKIKRDGILEDGGIVFGKVFVDVDCNNVQNDAEWPIGGVKLYLQDGTWAITDANGQYSIYGLKPGSHAIKMDTLTIPDGIVFKPTDNRQMADPHSRLVDIKSGEFHRADFAAACPKVNREQVEAEILARNLGRSDWMLENAKKYDPDKEIDGDELQKTSELDGDISSGKDSDLTAFSAGSKEAKRSLTTGYSIQLAKYREKALADQALSRLSGVMQKQAFVHRAGDFFTVRHGFDLDKKSTYARLKELALKKDATVVATIYEQVSDEVADRLETPRGLEIMTPVKEIVKSVTKDQAKKGGFLWPKGEVSLDGRFMVVTRKGLTPTLMLNGKAVPKSQLGEQIENRRERAQVAAWYGVQLEPGKNKLEVVAKDMFGNKRVLAKGTFTRPVSAEKLVIEKRTDQLSADGGRSYLPITIKLLDSNGYLARGVNFVTIEASDGQWVERDVQDQIQGRQVRVVNGLRVVHLRSSERSGTVAIRAHDGSMRAETKVIQVEPLRPLIAIGLLEVGSHMFKRGDSSPYADIEDDFDAQAALFLKGKVRGDMHLTMSVDTDKEDDAQLFRDINPNKSYPIHGDSSQRGYEAQSRSKVYAKLEKNKDSVMWGDFITDDNSINEDVTRVQRTLTGANLVTRGRAVEAQLFVSELNEQNVVERIRGQGVALNYKLSTAPIVTNSETIEIITVSRDNPGVVLNTQTLSRFGDYSLDSVTGELSFSETVPMNDEDSNPVFIRATYDLEGDGKDYTVAGVRLSHEVVPDFKLGFNYTNDQHETDGFELFGLTLDYKNQNGLEVRGSVGRMSHTDLSTDPGIAGRLYLAREWSDKSLTSVTLGRANQGFTNSAAGISENREEFRLKHEANIYDGLKAEVEAIHSKMLDTGDLEQSIGVTADLDVKDWTLKGGVRHIKQEKSTGDEEFQTFIVGAKKNINIGGRKGSIAAEYEQDLDSTDRRRIAISGDLQVHEKVKLYARGERINSLTGVSGLSSSTDEQDTIAIGVKSDFIKSTELFSEYRVRGGIDSRDLETASGIRGQYELVEGLSISPHLEIVNNIEGSGSDSVAASIALTDKRKTDQVASLRLETRHDDDRQYYGLQADYVRRLNSKWSALIKDTLRYELPEAGDNLIDNTFSLGLAYRPRLDNKRHALFFYQNKEERGDDSADCSTHILSTHQNYEIKQDVLLSGRLGGKLEDCDGVESDAVVLDGRVTWDLTNRLDLDVHAGVLATDGFGEQKYSLGAGVNYLVRKNLRVGIGYNLTGFKDEDLDPENYNDEGLYVGLKYKFDENSLNWLTGEQ